ncbi:TIGR04141 family sporadically distributed protein [Cronobacter sakazakii]|uniref:TIGR04141 family sporadically distributed protein n=1 Tax=Cronobacter sakazakii TaxID=28141 RepID=UPI000CFB32DF|nr:TIGR04141 family sporadically distributed protein [Cronobacter sakazakii]ELZ1657887.1 TIGR04141 family sporadically distributed protein [Cronobacter sakazakii]UWT86635.1 TIGR04141 family sporadically distributed protein [Cronobacter sakazakii]
MKTRSFSIFLLKEGYNAQNSLKPDHQLLNDFQAQNLPEGASLFISDRLRTTPWWVNYFSIRGDLEQENKGALIFLPVRGRCFALTFGHMYHNLLDVSYEYDFGLKVTLNSLEPKELKSADIVDPGASRRKRMQVPIMSDLTYLDFDSNSEILKSLTGKVKPQYEELFKNATGSTSLKVGLKLEPEELIDLCEQLLDLYSSNEYLESFPNIQKIVPEKDPLQIKRLDASLLEAFINKSSELSLSIPDIVDYSDNIYCIFKGRKGISPIYTNISLDDFYEYLGEIDLNTFDIEKIKKFSLNLCNEEGSTTKTYNIYRAFIYDIHFDDEGVVYHLCEGEWYKVDKDYLVTLKNYIDHRCENTSLPPYDHDNIAANMRSYSEENYNEDVARSSPTHICLDQTDISPDGYTQIEPCDIISYNGDTCIFHHIKISSRSSQLSHLFNQGVNSIELLILEKQSKDKLKILIEKKAQHRDLDSFKRVVDGNNYKVVFGIITKKPAPSKSENLPLFSKISLMRSLRALALYRTEGVVSFIEDKSPPKESFSKYPRITVVVSLNASGKNEVLVDKNQIFPQGKKVMRCSQEITNSPIGSKYMIYVKENKKGDLSTSHAWESERI